MKNLAFKSGLTILFFVIVTNLQAQSCDDMLKSAISQKEKQNYELAVKQLLATKNCDNSLSIEADKLLLQIFQDIEQIKSEAVKSKKKAERATQEANNLRELAENNTKLLKIILINTYSFIMRNEQLEDFSDWLVKSNDVTSLRPIINMLIKDSQSMDDEERQYWYNLSEIMTDVQHIKLMSILGKELAKLDEIEKKYGENDRFRIGKELVKNKEYEKAFRGVYLRTRYNLLIVFFFYCHHSLC